MNRWIPSELHTHTVHSDGQMTVMQLAQAAKKLGLACIALTDHNTIAGHLEIAGAERLTGITILPGLEWTTFYGHMTVLDTDSYIDWTDIPRSGIDQGIDRVHKSGGIAGVAHPFRLGSPMCTGGFWDFRVRDWTKPDTFEVWSETLPNLNPTNLYAYAMWRHLLSKGYRITAIAGRDWHSSKTADPVAFTYLHAESGEQSVSKQAAFQAIRDGGVVVTMGPLFTVEVQTEDRSFSVGETFSADSTAVNVVLSIEETNRGNQLLPDHNSLEAFLFSDSGLVARVPMRTRKLTLSVKTEEIAFLRAELYGKINGCPCLIAFTNPVFRYPGKEDE